ncbi:glycoside hydrolase family 25 protein [Prauserella endophytica]|uniref:Lysozyme n=1 Tax=Prauserella endophytica TaxID=1592324 RepID=A0ABY2RW75_9PSEU|nr:glycoside hydrolase family 25 protein [Prauserella endophytica]TKG63093.1 hypothetical protein FCN18_30445 [Prauserella endophytica]
MARGFDVSRWNTITDHAALAASGVTFGWAKISDGIPGRNVGPWHVAPLRNVGIKMGGYHFARTHTAPEVQVSAFIRELDTYNALDLPPVLDLEGAAEHGFTVDTTQGRAAAKNFGVEFLQGLAAAGFRPALYMNEYFATQLKPWEWGVPRLLLWVANYSRRPQVPHTVWQRSQTGRLPGVSGDIDLNESSTNFWEDPMAWRVARSLLKLRDQINARYPNRNKASDGTIGDADHQNRNSDHNPWYGPGIVTAMDITHDPAKGVDIDRLTDELQASRDSRIKYVIANNLIMSGAGGPSPWVWRRYAGPNPHTQHFHLSVVAAPACDDTRPWNLPSLTGGGGSAPGGGDDMTPEQDRMLRHVFNVLQRFKPSVEGGKDGAYDTGEYVRALYRELVEPKPAVGNPNYKTNVLGFARNADHYGYRNLQEQAGHLAAINKLAEAVANNSNVTPEELKAAVAEAIRENVVKVDVTVTGQEEQA